MDRENVIQKLQYSLEDAEKDGKIYAEIRRPVLFDAIALLKGQKPVRCNECKHYQNKDKKYDFAMCSELDICVDSDFYCKYWNK